MSLVDAHNHLDFDDFDADRDAVVARARAAGVDTWVLCGSRVEAWDTTVTVAAETGGIAVLGVHPWIAAALGAELPKWLDALRARPLTAVGEFGLDALWYRTEDAHRDQRTAVREQLALARERDLPVVLHCVRAYHELLAILERDGVPRAGGMVHAWGGPPDQVRRALALGLHVSFAPWILRDRAKKVRGSVPLVPDDRLLVETDCPSVAPAGTPRGEPAHLVQVVAEVAALRGQSPEHVARVTARNARALFGLPAPR